MASNPFISIIITTYQRPALLQRCIESALLQAYRPVEILVVDDGSTDSTEDVIRRYADLVRYVRKAHSGIAATRNAGCRAAKGKYIAFVDDDDTMHPRRISQLGSVLQEYPEAVCAFCHGNLIGDDGEDTGIPIWPHPQEGAETRLLSDGYERMLTGSLTLTPLNTLFKRDVGESIGWFDESFVHGCEDTDFFYRLCEVGSVAYVPKVLTYVNRSGQASLTGDGLRMAMSKLQLLDKHARLNSARGRRANASLLRQRQYHFMKLIVTAAQRSRDLQREYGLCVDRILWRLGLKRALYLLYLQYVQSRWQLPWKCSTSLASDTDNSKASGEDLGRSTLATKDGTGILAFVPDLWGDIWQSRHHVVSGLSEHANVLWVSPPTYVDTWRNEGTRAALTGRGLQVVNDRCWAYAPRLPADYKRRYAKTGLLAGCFRRYNAWWERRYVARIQRLIRDMDIDRVILYVWRPEFAKYAERIPHDLLCYHIDDEYSFSPSEDAPIADEEMRLLKKSDVVFIHSKTLLKKKGHINPNTHYMPNGVDFERFSKVMESGAAEPADLRCIPHHRIGYVGYIKRHIDLPLLLAIARKRRDWSLVLVGPVRNEHADIAADVAALRQEPNVHFLGGKDSQDVPLYIKGFDVCLMPYRVTDYTKYIYPMKLHEYLACGKPVVSTPLLNLREFGEILSFAERPGEWLEVIQSALNETGPEPVARRAAVAKENSWRNRVHEIATLLESALHSTAARRIPPHSTPWTQLPAMARTECASRS
ncbi:MAG: glycosyltransferase [Verrucomicrobia bacterium]|jgi:glycosyltransferase involved in cell wall biosynthesis|nr:glycosyltransferase [Verrucomicrobiota bacterium]